MLTADGMIKGVIPYPELTEEEKKMPLYKYFTRPLRWMGPLYSQALDHGPMDPKNAIPTSNPTLHLLPPGEYTEMNLGYCLHPEGGGFVRHYSFYPGAKFDMVKWYYTWCNIPCKSQPANTGNMKYKIWVPEGHYDHAFVNGVDRTEGVFTQENLALGGWKNAPFSQDFISVRYPLDLEVFGFSKKQQQELIDQGCWLDPSVVKYFDPKDYREKGIWTPILGSSVAITITRPTPGGVEKLSAEWVGWEVKDGKMVYDESTPWWRVTEISLKVGITHATTEAQHLADILLDLYGEYADKPMDAD